MTLAWKERYSGEGNFLKTAALFSADEDFAFHLLHYKCCDVAGKHLGEKEEWIWLCLGRKEIFIFDT